ncbi:hypothetical protein NC651_031069 [Populus alba x Populus x berolinensis]|nr:hypothetical protein NC651_031069 [Populus alba x Populus x berolinensis]
MENKNKNKNKSQKIRKRSTSNALLLKIRVILLTSEDKIRKELESLPQMEYKRKREWLCFPLPANRKYKQSSSSVGGQRRIQINRMDQ